LDANRRGLVHANQEPMAPKSGSNLIVKHRQGLVTDCIMIGSDCKCCRCIGQALDLTALKGLAERKHKIHFTMYFDIRDSKLPKISVDREIQRCPGLLYMFTMKPNNNVNIRHDLGYIKWLSITDLIHYLLLIR